MRSMVLCLFLSAMVLAGCSKQENKDGLAPEPEAQTHVDAVGASADESAESIETRATLTGEEAVPGDPALITAAVMSDLDKSLREVARGASELDTDGLKSQAQAYKHAILTKEIELNGLKEELRGLSMQEIVGDRGRELKRQVEECSAQITEFEKRHNIYLGKLRDAGVDLTDYSL